MSLGDPNPLGDQDFWLISDGSDGSVSLATDWVGSIALEIIWRV